MQGRRDDLSWSLVARAANGDGAAREAFGRAYLPVVRRLLRARWRGTPLASEVEDAVQETFVECLRDNGALGRADAARGDLGALMFGVARNVAARFEERAVRRQPLACGSVIDDVAAREPSLSAVFDREWAKTLMRLAGDRMRTASDRRGPGARLRVELLRLRFAEGLPIRDIAAQWEMDADAVHRAYAKAREEFRACLRAVVAEHAVRTGADLDREVERLLELLG